MTATAGDVQQGIVRSAPGEEAPTRPRRVQRRVGRGTGRTIQPQARPARPLRSPRLASEAAVPALGCRLPLLAEDRESAVVPARSASNSGQWRLTERGIALVLAAGLAIATAALVVVGLTAMRVTADNYAPHGQGQVMR
jgi:hypothetical protein